MQLRAKGAVLLILVIIILMAMSTLIFILAKQGQLSQKTTANAYRAAQAFEAAEAGMDFGIVYLEKNHVTILQDIDADGYVDAYSNSDISGVVLTNGSQFTITYSNPVVNDFSLIKITAVGSSADNSASREIRELVKYKPILTSFNNFALTVIGNLTLGGSTEIQNTQTDTTVLAGGSVNISGSATTTTSSGTSSTSSVINSDITQNDTALASTTPTSFFIDHFGVPADTIKSNSDYYYENNSSTNYNTQLSGKTGVLIWIEQTGGTATIDSSAVVGSAASPVILIVNGDLRIQGGAQIDGYVYVTGSLQTAGTATVSGGIAVGGNVVDSGNFTMIFDSTILSNLQQQMGSYAKVSGSWNDIKQ